MPSAQRHAPPPDSGQGRPEGQGERKEEARGPRRGPTGDEEGPERWEGGQVSARSRDPMRVAFPEEWTGEERHCGREKRTEK